MARCYRCNELIWWTNQPGKWTAMNSDDKPHKETCSKEHPSDGSNSFIREKKFRARKIQVGEDEYI